MQPATTRTIASVGSSIVGSGTSERRMSPGAWIVVARMDSSLPTVLSRSRGAGSPSLARCANWLRWAALVGSRSRGVAALAAWSVGGRSSPPLVAYAVGRRRCRSHRHAALPLAPHAPPLDVGTRTPLVALALFSRDGGGGTWPFDGSSRVGGAWFWVSRGGGGGGWGALVRG